jgi:hypothetical protein
MADGDQRDRAPGPVTASEPIEWRMALRGVLLVVAVGALFVGGAAVLADREALNGAVLGVAIVAGTMLLSGGALSLAAPFGPSALFAAALGGYVLKLGIYALLMVLLRDVTWLDGVALAVTSAILLVVALAWQSRLVLRDPRLLWIAPGDARQAAPGADRVVYTSAREPSLNRPSDPRSTERTSA